MGSCTFHDENGLRDAWPLASSPVAQLVLMRALHFILHRNQSPDWKAVESWRDFPPPTFDELKNLCVKVAKPLEGTLSFAMDYEKDLKREDHHWDRCIAMRANELNWSFSSLTLVIEPAHIEIKVRHLEEALFPNAALIMIRSLPQGPLVTATEWHAQALVTHAGALDSVAVLKAFGASP